MHTKTLVGHAQETANNFVKCWENFSSHRFCPNIVVLPVAEKNATWITWNVCIHLASYFTNPVAGDVCKKIEEE